MQMFSKRISWTLSENPLALELARLRDKGVKLLDLTLSNPTKVGLSYDPTLMKAFTRPEILQYTPHPRGLAATRKAISLYYAEEGSNVPIEAIHCTAGSSEAYSFVFKLLCDSGDSVLIPNPAYPLFEYLAALDNVQLKPYELRLSAMGRWRIDFSSLDNACDITSRAIVLVNPSNPVGAYVDPDDMEQIREFCRRRDLALIVDEVFWDYALTQERLKVRTVQENAVLTFTLNGLSKLAALPQVKLGWIVSSGPEAFLSEARSRLDLIADTYLSVSTPIMLAADVLLASRRVIQQQLRNRCVFNYAQLKESFSSNLHVSILDIQGGWSAVLALSSGIDEEKWVMLLLQQQKVFVHPGFFFDFPFGSFAVVSLLTPPELFAEGIKRIAAHVKES